MTDEFEPRARRRPDVSDRGDPVGDAAAVVAALRASEARYRAVVEAAPQLAWVNRADGSVEFFNRRWYDFTGQDASFAEGGRWLDALHPDDRERVRATREAAVAASEPYEVEVRLRRHDGAYRWFGARVVPARDTANTVGAWHGAALDIDDRRRREADQRFLLDLAAALAVLAIPVEIGQMAASAVGRRLELSRCRFCDVDLARGVYELGGMAYEDGGTPTEFAASEAPAASGVVAFPISAHVRADALAGRPTVVDDTRADLRTAPTHATVYGPQRVGAYMHLPLRRSGRWIASLLLDRARPHRWSDAEVVLAREVAERAWAAVETARLAATEHAARVAAEEARAEAEAAALQLQEQAVELEAANDALQDIAANLEEQTAAAHAASRAAQAERDAAALLADAGVVLASSLDVDDTLKRAARLSVPAFADYCVVDVLTTATDVFRGEPARDPRAPADIRRLAEAHVDPTLERVLAGTAAYYDAEVHGHAARGGGKPLLAVAQAGGVRRVEAVDDAWLRAAARSPAHLADMRRLAPRSLIIAGLWARGEPLGVMTFVRSAAAVAAGGRPFGPEDDVLAGQLAVRAADAIDRARLYGRARAANAALTATNATLATTLADAVRARAEAEAAREEAEQANRTRADFLASMSHELRTPLNAIQGYVALLEDGLYGPVTDEQRGALGRVRRAQAHLLGLVTDVLNFARLEEGRVVFDVGEVDLAEVVHDAIPLVATQAAAKGLVLDVVVPPAADGQVCAWADRDKLGQVLLNLLSNAIKFTPAARADGTAGRVLVEVTGRAETPAAAYLRVHDTGIGIPRDKQDAVFEPFVQVSTGLTRTSEGTGLGLAISRDLARGMGGDLRVRSAPGEGAVFTVTLRRAAR